MPTLRYLDMLTVAHTRVLGECTSAPGSLVAPCVVSISAGALLMALLLFSTLLLMAGSALVKSRLHHDAAWVTTAAWWLVAVYGAGGGLALVLEGDTDGTGTHAALKKLRGGDISPGRCAEASFRRSVKRFFTCSPVASWLCALSPPASPSVIAASRLAPLTAAPLGNEP